MTKSGEELIGKRFGSLLVVAVKKQSSGFIYLTCQCDCGKEMSTRRILLLAGESKSCGCGRSKTKRSLLKKAAQGDLSGRKFGRLVVVGFTGNVTPGRMKLWQCKCECGAEKIVKTSNLTCGITRSCGCLQRDEASEKRRVKLAGKLFGFLTAIKIVDRDATGNIRWLCHCKCGEQTTVRAAALNGGHIISCGCAAGIVGFRSESVRTQAVIRANRRRALKIGAGGTFTQLDIDRLQTLQKGRCAGCREKLTEGIHRDHILALSRGGSNDITNIQLLCPLCNLRKHAKSPDVWAKERGMLL